MFVANVDLCSKTLSLQCPSLRTLPYVGPVARTPVQLSHSELPATVTVMFDVSGL